MSKVDEYTGNGRSVGREGEGWAGDVSGLPDVIGV